ncbi:DNA polymerase IV [Chitinophagaceae bacterium LB-8]|uniref:DNA polymerase IV n=1 Tax=Paraflavisolibacter caeni TaxID=2982496 RepID=A0A9X2XNB9_9BACT|nr:DNA polymerase IV [Paraflavisolibacter caeni]MCU7547829.1 DNA polymerase IV [Paraflavisolibacter caeni]
MSHPVKHIAHFDLDAFFVSVEILKNPELKGKPLIVGGDGQRGIVAACSYEARKFGIQSAMPALTAKRLCPNAIFLKGSYHEYSKYSRIVTEIIGNEVPQFEKASIDEFYCDLTGMDRFFGVSQYTRELREKIIKETGLPISYGLSTSKLVSKMATNEAKPNGYLEIPAGKETAFLWPMNVDKIPMVGKQTTIQLHSMGISTIEQLAHTSLDLLEYQFGKSGKRLWEKARAIDDNPVEPYSEQKSLSHENTFHQDSNDLNFLHTELVKLTEETAYDLRQEEKLTGCVTVKIRYANFETVSRQEVIDYTALDNVLLAKVKNLFGKLYRKGEKVRLLGVRFSQLVPMTLQMNLFDNAEEKLELFKAVDDIKKQFGNNLLKKAATISRSSKEDQPPTP